MENIKLSLTIDETNAILAALGQQAYVKVADLIQKIHRQGASQLDNNSKTSEPAEKQKELEVAIPSKNGK